MSDDLIANMTKMAGIVANEIRSQAKNQRVPYVDRALSITPAEISKDKTEIRIKIIIDTTETGAPAAGAYEWGSGERATVGPIERITIPSNRKFDSKLLVWPKEDWPTYDPSYYTPPRPQPDWHVYREVHHPGVFPRPFIRPAISMHMMDIISLMGEGVVAQIMSKLKLVETIKIEV